MQYVSVVGASLFSFNIVMFDGCSLFWSTCLHNPSHPRTATRTRNLFKCSMTWDWVCVRYKFHLLPGGQQGREDDEERKVSYAFPTVLKWSPLLHLLFFFLGKFLQSSNSCNCFRRRGQSFFSAPELPVVNNQPELEAIRERRLFCRVFFGRILCNFSYLRKDPT